jgi:hypothetical protein
VVNEPRLQLSLFARASSTAFDQWLRDNPHMWELFERYTLKVIEAGHKHYSADAICHRIRWHVQVDTQDASGFKINNNHVAYLARRFERRHPQYVGFFRMRERKSA